MDDRSGSRMMNADEVRELGAAGVEIGGHTVTHPDLGRLDLEACRREVGECRATLREVTGQPVTSFAYPFRGFTSTSIRAVCEAGFTAAVTTEGPGQWSPFTLGRVMITGIDGTATFLAKLAGVYGPAFHSTAGTRARTLTRRPRLAMRRLRRGGWGPPRDSRRGTA
jgi:peptidoglycan/xylan/chitin deacetylase (PgdA/CDA1 family)